MHTTTSLWRSPARHLVSVPEITALFWILKVLSTAMGESTSDFLVHVMPPVLAVLMGMVAFVAALTLQFSMRRYFAWTYWLAVVMVGVFGTMSPMCCMSGSGCPISRTLLRSRSDRRLRGVVPNREDPLDPQRRQPAP